MMEMVVLLMLIIFLIRVNDAPVSTGDVDFGSIDEDSSFTISATDVIEKLLSTTTDVDGDTYR